MTDPRTHALNTAAANLRHYRNAPIPTDTDRDAADRAVDQFAAAAGLTRREALAEVTRLVLTQEKAMRDAAAAEAATR